MSQTQTILEMLKRGPVTLPMARQQAQCERLAARINDLRREGHQIETERIKTSTGKTVAMYRLKEKGNATC